MSVLRDSRGLKEQFRHFGRAGLSQRVIDLVEEFSKKPTYKAAIKLAGRLFAISIVARDDTYWDEKMSDGIQEERYFLLNNKAEIQGEEDSDYIKFLKR